MACFIGKIKSSSLSLNDLHCCSPAEPVTSDLFYGCIKAKLTSYGRLLANYSQMKNRFVCFLPKAMWGLKLSSKKREKKTTCIFKDYFTLACLFQSAPYPLNSQECINKQTNKRTMCRVFLTWKDIPTVADMSIDTQLKFASCYQPIYLCTVMLLCVLYSSVSYWLARPSLEVSRSPAKQAPY